MISHIVHRHVPPARRRAAARVGVPVAFNCPNRFRGALNVDVAADLCHAGSQPLIRDQTDRSDRAGHPLDVRQQRPQCSAVTVQRRSVQGDTQDYGGLSPRQQPLAQPAEVRRDAGVCNAAPHQRAPQLFSRTGRSDHYREMAVVGGHTAGSATKAVPAGITVDPAEAPRNLVSTPPPPRCGGVDRKTCRTEATQPASGAAVLTPYAALQPSCRNRATNPPCAVCAGLLGYANSSDFAALLR